MKLRDATLTVLLTFFWGWGSPKGIVFMGIRETRPHTFLEDLHWLIQRYWIEILKRLSFDVWYDVNHNLHWKKAE